MPKPWYEFAFGADYLRRYAHRDVGEARATVRRFLEHAQPPRQGVVLDLACGAGRHALALHAEGYRVVGLDLSRDLLRAAVATFERKTGCRNGATDACPLFIRGDMRSLPYADASFDAVTHFFTAFGYFDKDVENYGVFHEVARVLKPGGAYLFDFLSAPHVHRDLRDCETECSRENFADGSRVESMKSLSPDGLRVEKQVLLFQADELVNAFEERVRLFEPEQLRPALQAAGLVIQEEWGGYDAHDYRGAESPRWIALCRRI